MLVPTDESKDNLWYMILVVRSVFHKDNRYYPRFFFEMNICINHKSYSIVGKLM